MVDSHQRVGGPTWAVIYSIPNRLQKGDLDNKHRGKVLKYCELLLAANPSRPFVLCVLTNTVDLEVYKVTRSTEMEGPNHAERSSVVTMAGALNPWRVRPLPAINVDS